MVLPLKKLCAFSAPHIPLNVYIIFEWYHFAKYSGFDMSWLWILSIAQMGFIFLVSPFLAFYSDKYASRVGSRRKIILIATTLKCLVVFISFIIPFPEIPFTNVWVISFAIIHTMFYTLLRLNWISLAVDISHDYHDRTTLFGLDSCISSFTQAFAYWAVNYLPYQYFFLFGFFNHICLFILIIFGVLTLTPVEYAEGAVRAYDAHIGAPVLAKSASHQTCSGTIEAINDDGTYFVRFEDGNENPMCLESDLQFQMVVRIFLPREFGAGCLILSYDCNTSIRSLKMRALAKIQSQNKKNVVDFKLTYNSIELCDQAIYYHICDTTNKSHALRLARISGNEKKCNKSMQEKSDNMSFVSSMVCICRNRPFVIFFATQTFVWTYFVGPRSQIIRPYSFKGPQQILGWGPVLSQLSLCVINPFLMMSSYKFGKKNVLMVLELTWIIFFTLSMITINSEMSFIYEDIDFLGILFYGSTLFFINSMLTDIIDYDQLLWDGPRRVALYYCIFSSGIGLDNALNLIGSTLINLAGYSTIEDLASITIQLGMRYLIMILAIPGIFGVLCLLKYKISESSHIAIRKTIQSRYSNLNQEESSVIELSEEELSEQEVSEQEVASLLKISLSSAKRIINPLTKRILPDFFDSSNVSVLDRFTLWELKVYHRQGEDVLRYILGMRIFISMVIACSFSTLLVYFGIYSELIGIYIMAFGILFSLFMVDLFRYYSIQHLVFCDKSDINKHIFFVSSVCDIPQDGKKY